MPQMAAENLPPVIKQIVKYWVQRNFATTADKAPKVFEEDGVR